MQEPAAQMHDIQGKVNICDKDITAILDDNILGHVLCYSQLLWGSRTNPHNMEFG